MRKLLSLLLMLLLGLPVGGAAAYATIQLLGPVPGSGPAQPPPADPIFVPAGKILAPLVSRDGRLTGYVSFDFALEVGADKAGFVTSRLPFLLNAINMRTYRAPMASGPDGMLPNLDVFRRIVDDSAKEAFGAGVVRHAAITAAVPA